MKKFFSFNNNVKFFSRSNLYLLFFIFIITLFFQSCAMIHISNPDYPYHGDIQINSEPAGADIYLDGVYTGFSTPHTLTNIAHGSRLITLKLLGYLNSNNIVQVYPNQVSILDISLIPVTIPPTPVFSYLTEIETTPSYFNLSAGEIGYINSVVTYYSDGTSKNIPLNNCTIISINQDIATVSSNGKITGISGGETIIWVVYTENNTTRSDTIDVYVSGEPSSPGNLVSIEVLPSTMKLNIGESKSISSITAYYDNNTEKNINPAKCLFSSNNSVASVNKYGVIIGEESGSAIVTVLYTEEDITKIDTISVTVSPITIEQPSYRALAIGIGDYMNYGFEGDLIAPPYDVEKIKSIFNDCWFGPEGTTFSRIDTLIDTQATKANILQKIQTVFSGANQNDVSYFYYSGHGYSLNQTSYLCPTDFNGETENAISVNELESALSAIPGTKVVLIDSCNSGGFIGKSASGNEETEVSNYLVDFNESIINTFANKPLSKDLLTSSEYQVLTSSHWYQVSYEIQPIDDDPFGVFTQGLYEGCSLDNNVPADVNQDDKIALQEAYEFISQWVASMRYNQNVQVHPLNSNFTIFEY
jgi:hypothetical protein